MRLDSEWGDGGGGGGGGRPSPEWLDLPPRAVEGGERAKARACVEEGLAHFESQIA